MALFLGEADVRALVLVYVIGLSPLRKPQYGDDIGTQHLG